MLAHLSNHSYRSFKLLFSRINGTEHFQCKREISMVLRPVTFNGRYPSHHSINITFVPWNEHDAQYIIPSYTFLQTRTEKPQRVYFKVKILPISHPTFPENVPGYNVALDATNRVLEKSISLTINKIFNHKLDIQSLIWRNEWRWKRRDFKIHFEKYQTKILCFVIAAVQPTYPFYLNNLFLKSSIDWGWMDGYILVYTLFVSSSLYRRTNSDVYDHLLYYYSILSSSGWFDDESLKPGCLSVLLVNQISLHHFKIVSRLETLYSLFSTYSLHFTSKYFIYFAVSSFPSSYSDTSPLLLSALSNHFRYSFNTFDYLFLG